jgi:hypothetical protein
MEFMEEVKADREARDRTAVIINRQRIVCKLVEPWLVKRGRTEAWPCKADICEMSAFKEIIELPNDTVVNEDSFDLAVLELDASCLQWRAEMQRKMADMVRVPQGQAKGRKVKKGKFASSRSDVSVLELATTWFKCTSCSQIVMDPSRTISHRCATYYRQWLPDPGDRLHSARQNIGCVSWNELAVLEYHSLAADIATSLLELCRKDAATTTRGEMAGARFRCNECTIDNPGPVLDPDGGWVADFKRAIIHTYMAHSKDNVRTVWTPLDDADTAQVRKLEDTALLDLYHSYENDRASRKGWVHPTSSWSNTVWCLHCQNHGPHPITFTSMRWHLQKT